MLKRRQTTTEKVQELKTINAVSKVVFVEQPGPVTP